MTSRLQSIKKRILPILKRNHIKKASIFGSFARGIQTNESDVDIIIEPPKGIGLGFVGIKLELEEKLGRKVDLITYKSIHPYLKRSILESEVRIL